MASCEFDSDKHRLEIEINFLRGSLFACPICGREGCSAYDTERHEWRHLNFFQHEAYLSARVSCGDCGIKTIEVPWARSGSGFTLLFEALIMMMAKAMPVISIADIIKEHDTRLWWVLNHYVHESRQGSDFSAVTQVGVDETSSKRGHNYVSLFVDMKSSQVLFVTPFPCRSRVTERLRRHGSGSMCEAERVLRLWYTIFLVIEVRDVRLNSLIITRVTFMQTPFEARVLSLFDELFSAIGELST